MISLTRLPLRLARQSTRAFATKRTPSGPRGSLRKPPPTRKVPPPRKDSSQPPKGSQNASQQPQKADNASQQPSDESTAPELSKTQAVSNALAEMPASQNSLLTPVHMPEDPHAILKETHPVMRLLDNSSIVIQRQLEMMNVLMGFEQANRYIIMDPLGNHIGYLAEQDHGIGSTITRQMFKTHRSFTTHVFDKNEKEVLRFHRPFAMISSRMRVYDAVGKDGGAYTHSVALQGTSAQSVVSDTSASVSSTPLSEMRIIGAAEQEWGLLRRKYNMYLARNLDDTPAVPGTAQLASGDLPLSNSKALQVVEGDQREVGMMQFARVDEPFLSWDFSLKSDDGRLIGSVNRNFGGFAREIFTDTGVYALRMDAAGLTTESGSTPGQSEPFHMTPGMTLDQRAVMLATAVSIDFDYFSRHSGAGGGMGMWPMWMPWFGGGGEAAGAAAGGAAAGEAGAIGAAGAAGETGIASEVAGAARGLGVGEGAAAGAGTMAGYEAMRSRGEHAAQEADSASPQAGNEFAPDQQQPPGGQGEDFWGNNENPWGQDGGGGKGGGDAGGGEGGGEGGGDGLDPFDWF